MSNKRRHRFAAILPLVFCVFFLRLEAAVPIHCNFQKITQAFPARYHLSQEQRELYRGVSLRPYSNADLADILLGEEKLQLASEGLRKLTLFYRFTIGLSQERALIAAQNHMAEYLNDIFFFFHSANLHGWFITFLLTTGPSLNNFFDPKQFFQYFRQPINDLIAENINFLNRIHRHHFSFLPPDDFEVAGGVSSSFSRVHATEFPERVVENWDAGLIHIDPKFIPFKPIKSIHFDGTAIEQDVNIIGTIPVSSIRKLVIYRHSPKYDNADRIVRTEQIQIQRYFLHQPKHRVIDLSYIRPDQPRVTIRVSTLAPRSPASQAIQSLANLPIDKKLVDIISALKSKVPDAGLYLRP